MAYVHCSKGSADLPKHQPIPPPPRKKQQPTTAMLTARSLLPAVSRPKPLNPEPLNHGTSRRLTARRGLTAVSLPVVSSSSSKGFRNNSHTSHGQRPGLKRNKSKGKSLTINPEISLPAYRSKGSVCCITPCCITPSLQYPSLLTARRGQSAVSLPAVSLRPCNIPPCLPLEGVCLLYHSLYRLEHMLHRQSSKKRKGKSGHVDADTPAHSLLQTVAGRWVIAERGSSMHGRAGQAVAGRK